MASFYGAVRKSMFRGKLRQSQVDGLDVIVFECQQQEITDRRQIAYILATVYHEVAGTMQPIEEFGKGKNRTYGHKVRYSGKAYNHVPHIYFGRGYTQNTWIDNYEALTYAAQKQGFDWDFVNHPELLLKTKPSAWATIYAMKVGLYTGKRLSMFFNDNVTDPIMARKIINGTRKGELLPDKAELIAGYYHKFLQALT